MFWLGENFTGQRPKLLLGLVRRNRNRGAGTLLYGLRASSLLADLAVGHRCLQFGNARVADLGADEAKAI